MSFKTTNADGWEEKETWKMWSFLSFPAPVSLAVSMASDGHGGGKNFFFLSGKQAAVLAMITVHLGSDLPHLYSKTLRTEEGYCKFCFNRYEECLREV